MFKSVAPCPIRWPDAGFPAITRGLINVFAGVVFFVDGSKQRAWRPQDHVLQEFIYDGHHHFHAYNNLFRCDVFGRCWRFDFTLKGSMHDLKVYKNTAVGQNPEKLFTRDAADKFIESVTAEWLLKAVLLWRIPKKETSSPLSPVVERVTAIFGSIAFVMSGVLAE